MSFFNLQNIARISGGTWIVKPEADTVATGLSIDTRTLESGQIYGAIAGERFDGHDFATVAAEAGASLLLTEKPLTDAIDCPTLQVSSTVETLATLGRAYRRTLNATIIAITGSAGKTTTKHLLGSVLSQSLTGSASPKSFNNEIGVPLTLLAASADDQFVLCEVGTNAPGEIRTLGQICEPDIAVITTVGPAHLEGLGSVEAVHEEKTSLIDTLADDGLAVINSDVVRLPTRSGPTITFGRNDGAALQLTQCQAEPPGVRFEVNHNAQFRIQLPGVHNATNALAVIGIARHLGLSEQAIAEGLASAEAPKMRLATEAIGPITLINDAYNANPLSVGASLNVLSEMPTTGKRVAILGDMGELGTDSPQLHAQTGSDAASLGLDLLIYVGPLSRHSANAAKQSNAEVHWFESLDDSTAEQIAAYCSAGDVILLKASRSAALERIVPHLNRRAEQMES